MATVTSSLIRNHWRHTQYVSKDFLFVKLVNSLYGKVNKKSPKEASKLFHDIMKASVNPPPKAVTPPQKNIIKRNDTRCRIHNSWSGVHNKTEYIQYGSLEANINRSQQAFTKAIQPLYEDTGRNYTGNRCIHRYYQKLIFFI